MTNFKDHDLYEMLVTSEKEAAFRCLYERHSGGVFRFLYRFTLNSQLAEELLQDIFIELLESRLDKTAEINVKAWLFTLAKNKSLNLLKKMSHETKNDRAILAAVSSEDAEAVVVGDDLLRRLARLEPHLPADLQQTWSLRKDGLDYKEIAEMLSIPIGTVKSRLSRLVEFLSREFKGVEK